MDDREFYSEISHILRDDANYKAETLNMILVKNKDRIACLYEAEVSDEDNDDHEYDLYSKLEEFFNDHEELYMGIKIFDEGAALIYHKLLINPNLNILEEYDAEVIGLILGYSCNFPVLCGKTVGIVSSYEIYDSADKDGRWRELFTEVCETERSYDTHHDIMLAKLDVFRKIFENLYFKVRLVLMDNNRTIIDIYI